MLTNTQKIAAIGPRELISVLESIGIDTYAATTREEAEAHVYALREHADVYGILCITDSVSQKIDKKLLAELRNALSPALLIIPDLQSTSESDIDRIRDLARRATGSDILA